MGLVKTFIALKLKTFWTFKKVAQKVVIFLGYFFEEIKIRLQPKKQPKRRNYAQSGHTAFRSVESVDNCRPYFVDLLTYRLPSEIFRNLKASGKIVRLFGEALRQRFDLKFQLNFGAA